MTKLHNTVIVCIAGGSGVGKTYAASKLHDMFNEHGIACNLICSSTTRPMRAGEQDGVDHKFLTKSDYDQARFDDVMTADTYFGGEYYWTTIDDFAAGKVNLYVIDEPGIMSLHTKYPDAILIMVRLVCSDSTLAERNIDASRLSRDISPILDYHLTTNNDCEDDIKIAYRRLRSILDAECCRRQLRNA